MTFFTRGASLQTRFISYVLISILFMLADRNLTAFTQVRYTLNNIATVLQYVAHSPYHLMTSVYEGLRHNDSLKKENAQLRDILLRKQTDLLLLDHYKEENKRINALLGSIKERTDDRVIAEVLSIQNSLFNHQIVLNKGLKDGVYVNQPVINEYGVVGKVSDVSEYTSKVLLLIDGYHGIPVQVQRNDIRAILSGTGQRNSAELEFVASSTDIQVGDKLLSSGLGGVYPEGYPVAVVTHVENEGGHHFANITVEPIVDFDRLRYVLLVWSEIEQSTATPLSEDEDN